MYTFNPAMRRRWRALYTLTLGLAFFLRVWHLGDASLWIDEVFTYERASGSLLDTLEATLKVGNHVPLYFLSLHALPISPELALRYSAALTGLMGVALFIGIIQRLYRSRSMALWAGLLLAVNPYHVCFSRTARPYSMLFLFALLSSYFFLQILTTRPSKTLWLAFILSSSATYMTHMLGLMLPAAQYIAFAFELRRRRATFRHWLGAQGLAILPLLFWLIALTQVENLTIGIEWIPTPRLEDLFLTLQNMSVGHLGSLHWYQLPGLLIVIFALGMVLVRAIQQTSVSAINLYWLVLVFTPTLATFLLSAIRPLYVDRYFMSLLPGFLALIIIGCQQLKRRSGKIALLATLCASCFITTGTEVAANSGEIEDWRTAVATVRNNYQPGDALLLQHTFRLTAVAHYYGQEAVSNLPIYTVLDGHSDLLLFDGPRPNALQRLWTFYARPGASDVHRLTAPPPFDPFSPSLTPFSSWLIDHQNNVLETYHLRGMVLLLIDCAGDASNPCKPRSGAPALLVP